MVALLTFGVLAALLSACGSSSSTGSGDSTAAVIKKEAGLTSKDVKLTVINEYPETERFLVCFSTPANCENLYHGPHDTFAPDQPVAELRQGQSISHQSARPQGELYVQEGGASTDTFHVSFEAFNPSVGEPWISVGGSGRNFEADQAGLIRLSEGEAQERQIGSEPDSPTVEVERQADTDYKVMTLTVHP